MLAPPSDIALGGRRGRCCGVTLRPVDPSSTPAPTSPCRCATTGPPDAPGRPTAARLPAARRDVGRLPARPARPRPAHPGPRPARLLPRARSRATSTPTGWTRWSPTRSRCWTTPAPSARSWSATTGAPWSAGRWRRTTPSGSAALVALSVPHPHAFGRAIREDARAAGAVRLLPAAAQGGHGRAGPAGRRRGGAAPVLPGRLADRGRGRRATSRPLLSRGRAARPAVLVPRDGRARSSPRCRASACRPSTSRPSTTSGSAGPRRSGAPTTSTAPTAGSTCPGTHWIVDEEPDVVVAGGRRRCC